MLAVCGAALCENVEGSFLCLCASDLEEYDTQEGRCRPRVAGGEPRTPPHRCAPPLHGLQSTSTAPALRDVGRAGLQLRDGAPSGEESESAVPSLLQARELPGGCRVVTTLQEAQEAIMPI